MTSRTTRRRFLQASGSLLGSVLATSRIAGASTDAPLGTLQVSATIQQENQKLGDGSWIMGRPAQPGDIEGYASAPSVNLGETISFFVSTVATHYRAKVFRMGYYQGYGAHLVETRTPLSGRRLDIPTPDVNNTVDCDWPVSFTLEDTGNYVPGQYLVRLELPTGEYSFIPFLIRDDESTSTYVYMSSVNTWQAYNAWGGYSLYRGADHYGNTDFDEGVRATIVSFNRPYSRHFGNGSGDFVGNEFPFLFLAEKLGLDLSYWTNVDLHQRGNALTQHQALISLGHDEYYSPPMRLAATNAIDAGVNVAFLGANFCYRKIRYLESYNGANRLMVNYRSIADPIYASDPSATTVNWSDWPSDTPESTFSGSHWGGVPGEGSLVVCDASSWLWSGAGLDDGDVLEGALGGEFNNHNPTVTNPPNVQLFGHSPVVGGISDITYSAQPDQGGVFCTGTGWWIYRLSNAPLLGNRWVPAPVPGVTSPLTTATQNLLALLGGGPCGLFMPSVATLA
jgi:hypothetical protein